MKVPKLKSPRRLDWRKLKYREELFFRYFTWRSSVHDLDHSHYCQTLTFGMTDEQKCWFAFLFGMTYRTPQAYAYWFSYPNFEKIDLEEVEDWNHDNWKRATYGTDARYNKGHFHSQTSSLVEWMGEYDSLLAKVKDLTSSDNPEENFLKLFESVGEVYKYGRMTGWITCQCLYDVLELNIDFDNVLVRNPNSDSSMQSIWNGYWMLQGKKSKLLGKQYSSGNYSVTPKDLEFVSSDIMKYKEKAEKYSGSSVDVFKWESIWCQFKRLFNEKGSKEYPGHSSGDAASRYLYYREHWPEVDWMLFREALLSQDSIIKGQTYRNEYNKVFGETGLVLNIHEMYDDMPDAYEVLGLDPNENLVSELFLDHDMEVPTI
jgi:hypothetical protein